MKTSKRKARDKIPVGRKRGSRRAPKQWKVMFQHQKMKKTEEENSLLPTEQEEEEENAVTYIKTLLFTFKEDIL